MRYAPPYQSALNTELTTPCKDEGSQGYASDSKAFNARSVYVDLLSA
jgi:hypothetical protein